MRWRSRCSRGYWAFSGWVIGCSVLGVRVDSRDWCWVCLIAIAYEEAICIEILNCDRYPAYEKMVQKLTTS